MDLIRSLSIAASGLKAQAGRMRIISENLANADSTATKPGGDPYRRKIVTFDRKFDHELEKALGSKVEQLMSDEPITCGPDDTIEAAATLLHDRHVSRLPVVDADGRLVGVVSRHDILRAILEGGAGPA